MKKGMKPELSSKWWSKNKPKTLTKTGLGAALKDYEIAREKNDLPEAVKALKGVELKVAVAKKKASPKLHGSTIEVLGTFGAVINKAKADIAKLIKAQQKKPAGGGASAPPPPQQMGKPVVIWKRDLGAMALKVYHPQWISKLDKWGVQQALNDDILKVFEDEGDYVTPQQIVDDSEAMGKKAVAIMVKEFKKIDKEIAAGKIKDSKALAAVFKTRVTPILGVVKDELSKMPEARWKKFVAQKKQYKKYKIKTGVKIGTGAVGIVAGLGGLGLGIAAAAGAVPTMGGSLALAIPGLVAGFLGTLRSCAAMTKQLMDIYRSAEKVERVLAKDLDTLKKRYDNACKAKIVAGETGASTIKGILGTDTPFLATIPKCNDNHDLLGSKVAHIAVTTRDLSKNIMKGLKESEKIEKDLKTLKDAKARKAYDKLVKARAALAKALDKCSDVGARMTKLEKALPKLKTMLDALNAKNPQFNKIFDKVFPSVVSGVLILTGAGTGFADSSSVADFVTTSVGLVTDVGLEVADIVQDQV